MLLSPDAFGALSAADISKLFGAISPSNATSKSADQSASTSASASSTSDPVGQIKAILAQATASGPANTIKSILAQVQITQAATATSDGSAVTVATTAYLHQTLILGTADGNGPASAIKSILAQPQTESGQPEASDGSAVSVATMGWANGDPAYPWEDSSGTTLDASIKNSTTGDAEQIADITSSTSDQANEMTVISTSNPQGEQSDHIELTNTFRNNTVDVGFTIDGIGPMSTDPKRGDAMNVDNPQGNLSAILNVSAFTGGLGGGVQLVINGLSAAQAQQVESAFGQATNVPGEINDPSGPDSGFIYDRTASIAPNFTLGVAGYISGENAVGEP